MCWIYAVLREGNSSFRPCCREAIILMSLRRLEHSPEWILQLIDWLLVAHWSKSIKFNVPDYSVPMVRNLMNPCKYSRNQVKRRQQKIQKHFMRRPLSGRDQIRDPRLNMIKCSLMRNVLMTGPSNTSANIDRTTGKASIWPNLSRKTWKSCTRSNLNYLRMDLNFWNRAGHWFTALAVFLEVKMKKLFRNSWQSGRIQPFLFLLRDPMNLGSYDYVHPILIRDFSFVEFKKDFNLRAINFIF